MNHSSLGLRYLICEESSGRKRVEMMFHALDPSFAKFEMKCDPNIRDFSPVSDPIPSLRRFDCYVPISFQIQRLPRGRFALQMRGKTFEPLTHLIEPSPVPCERNDVCRTRHEPLEILVEVGKSIDQTMLILCVGFPELLCDR